MSRPKIYSQISPCYNCFIVVQRLHFVQFFKGHSYFLLNFSVYYHFLQFQVTQFPGCLELVSYIPDTDIHFLDGASFPTWCILLLHLLVCCLFYSNLTNLMFPSLRVLFTA